MSQESGEKTEMPTPKKLRDARSKGQVCVSKDVVSTAALLAAFIFLGVLGAVLVDDFSSLISHIARSFANESSDSWRESLRAAVLMTLKHSLIFVIGVAATAVVVHVAEIGFIFTFEPMKPDLNKLNPVEGVKRIFAKKNLFEFLKNILKILFLGYLVWKIIAESAPELLTLAYGDTDDIMPAVTAICKRLAAYSLFGYAVIAAADFVFQRKDFMRQMMMTKDEVKREYKEMEGSAETKQAQRRFRDEILNGPDPAAAARKANVIVTNPTHIAVGVRYEPNEMRLPMIVAAGADSVAAVIREAAREAGIPIMENIPLARGLYALGKVDSYIPEEFIEPVAEVLKWVKRLEDARKEERELEEISL